jgi:hypothetical protein
MEAQAAAEAAAKAPEPYSPNTLSCGIKKILTIVVT